MAGEVTTLSLSMGLGVVSGGVVPPPPYTPTGTLLAGFEDTNEWTQPFSPQRAVSLDPVNKVQGSYALKYSPNALSNSGPIISKALPSFDPQSLKAYAVYVKLPTDIAWQSVNSITVGFRVNAGGTIYNGASRTVLANIWTDGMWLSGNVSQLNAAFSGAGVGNHDVRITCAETDAQVGEVSIDAFYTEVLANEPAPVVMTFDDAKPTHASIVLPDLIANDLRGTFYIPTDNVDAGGAGVMSWTDIQAANASGKVLIAPNGTGNDNAITSPDNLVSELEKQNTRLVAKGIPRATEFCWPFGFIRQAPSASNRFVRTGVNIPSGTDTLPLSSTTGISVGQRAVLVGVSTNCRVIAVNTDTSVQLSEPMTISATSKAVVFVDDSNVLFGNKAIDAAIAAGYKMGRSTINARAFVGFGFSRRFGMQFPSYPGNGQTAASLLALIDSAITEKAAVSFYFHGIATGEFPPAEWATFIAGVKARQDAGLIKTMTLTDINDRYSNAKPPSP